MVQSTDDSLATVRQSGLILQYGTKVNLIVVFNNDSPGWGFNVTQCGAEDLYGWRLDHSRIHCRHCSEMWCSMSGMVIFIICYIKMHKTLKQVLVDWGQWCPSSDDASVASSFLYLIPDLQ